MGIDTTDGDETIENSCREPSTDRIETTRDANTCHDYTITCSRNLPSAVAGYTASVHSMLLIGSSAVVVSFRISRSSAGPCAPPCIDDYIGRCGATNPNQARPTFMIHEPDLTMGSYHPHAGTHPAYGTPRRGSPLGSWREGCRLNGVALDGIPRVVDTALSARLSQHPHLFFPVFLRECAQCDATRM